MSPPRLSFPPQEKQKTGPQAASFQNPRFPSGRAWDGRAPHTPRLTGLAFSRRCPLLPANQAPSLVPFSAVGPKLRAPSPSAQARPWVKLPTRSAAHSGKAWNEVLASLVFLSETERERDRSARRLKPSHGISSRQPGWGEADPGPASTFTSPFLCFVSSLPVLLPCKFLELMTKTYLCPLRKNEKLGVSKTRVSCRRDQPRLPLAVTPASFGPTPAELPHPAGLPSPMGPQDAWGAWQDASGLAQGILCTRTSSRVFGTSSAGIAGSERAGGVFSVREQGRAGARGRRSHV